MLIVVNRLPTDERALERAAAVTGMSMAEVGWRLRGPMPRVLAVTSARGGLQDSVRVLVRAGFGAFACDPNNAPSDQKRFVARNVRIADASLELEDERGRTMVCPAGAIGLVQRGVRRASLEGRPMRGGSMGSAAGDVPHLLREKIGAAREDERFLLINRIDGLPDIMLYERRLDYRWLGEAKRMTSRANLGRVAEMLAQIAPAAPLDDTVMRPGFLSGMPGWGGADLDLALHVISLARLGQNRR